MPLKFNKVADEYANGNWTYTLVDDVNALTEQQKEFCLLLDVVKTLRKLDYTMRCLDRRLVAVEKMAKDVNKRFKKIDAAEPVNDARDILDDLIRKECGK